MASDIFPDDVKTAAGDRQDWLCALCGALLEDDEAVLVKYDAHHLNRDLEDDSVMNCVLLCSESYRNCHFLIHAWNWQNHPVEEYELRFLKGDPDAEYDDDEYDEGDD